MMVLTFCCNWVCWIEFCVGLFWLIRVTDCHEREIKTTLWCDTFSHLLDDFFSVHYCRVIFILALRSKWRVSCCLNSLIMRVQCLRRKREKKKTNMSCAHATNIFKTKFHAFIINKLHPLADFHSIRLFMTLSCLYALLLNPFHGKKKLNNCFVATAWVKQRKRQRDAKKKFRLTDSSSLLPACLPRYENIKREKRRKFSALTDGNKISPS